MKEKIKCHICGNEIKNTQQLYSLEIRLKESIMGEWGICEKCADNRIEVMEKHKAPCKICKTLQYTNPYADSYECVECGRIFPVKHDILPK